ncbi:hypothetical protein SAMN05421858_4990 [Haladaptatus litoreus]|uniref:Uncharacterized protein n=1 Tax=Haladaptatus litoreus TaxID=553468 RepID=A0A1N7FDY3_9EURY|nr:hypothetical protein SAMN05421858_4990 [Haladaptatus litoreus]
MLVKEFEDRANIPKLWSSLHFVSVLVPVNKPLIFQSRQVFMMHRWLAAILFHCHPLGAGIVLTEFDEEPPPSGICQSIERIIDHVVHIPLMAGFCLGHLSLTSSHNGSGAQNACGSADIAPN